MKFLKQPISIQDQISLLKSRNLIIANEEKAQHYLATISYYRLSAYMLPFQKKDGSHIFFPDSSFQKIIDLYAFDRELKLLIFDAIERIEIAIRTKIIYDLSLKYGSHWHNDANLFSNNTVFFNLQKSIADACAQRHKEIFIEHYLNKYSEPAMPPSWMSLEIITLGQLSQVFNALRDKRDKKEIALFFGLYPEVLQSWAHSITYVRNICAHHGRLWNREFGIRPILLKSPKHNWISESFQNNSRVYYFLCCMYYLLNTVNPTGHFKEKLILLIQKYPNVQIKYMGFPDNWQTEPLWKNS